jgi:hypothetical protein
LSRFTTVSWDDSLFRLCCGAQTALSGQSCF